MLAIIQGLYILRDDEAVAEEYDEEPDADLYENADASYGGTGREQFYDKGIDPERYAEFLRDLEEADARDGRK
jgi:hypothetical protein